MFQRSLTGQEMRGAQTMVSAVHPSLKLEQQRGRNGPPARGDELLKVSVVMPCLNEERTVGRCVEKALRPLGELGVRGEVVIADNGSTDQSVEMAARAGARVVHQALKGYGNALRKGFAEARDRYVIMGDCDDSYDFTDLGRFVERLLGGAEVVLGNRLKGEIKPWAMPMPWLHRWVGNPGLT
jgi:glycosyltransferase involved in cell wall biosynthesis